jgi:Zn-finger nucleic acid-binding protein
MADNEKILNCPACGTEMKKIPLENYGFCIDICLDGCGSIVFDNREFQKFDEKTENIDPILSAYEGK